MGININLATKENLQILLDRQIKREADIVLLLQREIEEVDNDILVTRLMYLEAENRCIEEAIVGQENSEANELAMNFKAHLLMLEKKRNSLSDLMDTYKMKSSEKEKSIKDLASMAAGKAKDIGSRVNKENVENIGKNIIGNLHGLIDMLKEAADEAAVPMDEKDSKDDNNKSSRGIKIEIQ